MVLQESVCVSGAKSSPDWYYNLAPARNTVTKASYEANVKKEKKIAAMSPVFIGAVPPGLRRGRAVCSRATL